MKSAIDVEAQSKTRSSTKATIKLRICEGRIRERSPIPDFGYFGLLPSLLFDVLLQILGSNLGSVDDASGIDGHALGGACAGGILHRIGNERLHGAVEGASDADAPLPCGVIESDRARLRIGDVKHIVLIDEDSAGPAELPPFRDEFALLIEDLDAIVAAVGDEQAAFGIERQGMGNVDLSRGGALGSPGLEEFSALGKLYDARVAVAAMAVRNEDVAVRSDGHRRGLIESVVCLACDAGFAERHQNFAVRTEFEYLVAFSGASLPVGGPDVSVLIRGDAVRKNKHSRAKTFQQLA